MFPNSKHALQLLVESSPNDKKVMLKCILRHFTLLRKPVLLNRAVWMISHMAREKQDALRRKRGHQPGPGCPCGRGTS